MHVFMILEKIESETQDTCYIRFALVYLGVPNVDVWTEIEFQ